jgi:hypothetical protein
MALNVKSVAIQSFATFLIGSNVFSRIISVVTRQNDKPLTSDEKRHAALEEIKLIGIELGEWAIRLGLELAVAFIKSKAK